MKQFYLQNTVSNQIHLSNIDAGCGMNQLTNRELSRYAIPQSPLPALPSGRRLQGGGHSGLNIFLIQNKGKGPPGYSRSPGVGDGLFPDHPPDGEACPPDDRRNPVRFSKPVRIEPSHEQALKNPSKGRSLSLSKGWSLSLSKGELNINTEIQIFNKNQNSNFLQTLKFIIMKKQILFLTFFVLAVLASITDTFGQSTASSFAPRTLTGCTDYPLHPLPGKAYQYEVTNPTGGPVATYQWWATKDPNFINATGGADLTNMLDVSAGELIATSGNYGTATAGGSTVSITWSPQILANTQWQGTASISAFPSPTFVVVKAEGSCTNNLQVYEINPMKAFTVDIANWDPATTATLAYDATASSCVDVVRGASYDSGAKEVVMDYGTNTITFEVIAANFVDTWKPLFEITAGLTDDQTAQIGWAYTQAAAAAGTFVDSSTPGLTLATGTFSGTVDVTTAAANTAGGVSIWVTVIITNNTYESLADQPFTLAVDGVDSTGQWDLTSACVDPGAADQVDLATQVLTARPDVDDATVDPQTNPDTFIPKQ